jgi:hypothetical protein
MTSAFVVVCDNGGAAALGRGDEGAHRWWVQTSWAARVISAPASSPPAARLRRSIDTCCATAEYVPDESMTA